MNYFNKLVVGLAIGLTACGGDIEGMGDKPQALGQSTESLTAYGFYGIRVDGANTQRLCAAVPSASQICVLPDTKTIRVKLDTAGMHPDDATLAQQWVTAIINNTYNPLYGTAGAGWHWLEATTQVKLAIKYGAVDDSFGADATDIRRYLRITCKSSSPALTENPSTNGTYHVCSSWSAVVDTEKMYAHNSVNMTQQIHHAVAIAMMAPAGIGVGNITPGKITNQIMAQTSFASTSLSARDACALTKFDPTDLTTINFVGGC